MQFLTGDFDRCADEGVVVDELGGDTDGGLNVGEGDSLPGDQRRLRTDPNRHRARFRGTVVGQPLTVPRNRTSSAPGLLSRLHTCSAYPCGALTAGRPARSCFGVQGYSAPLLDELTRRGVLSRPRRADRPAARGGARVLAQGPVADLVSEQRR